VYSLGVIFYELLTGHHPDQPIAMSSEDSDLAMLLPVPAAYMVRGEQVMSLAVPRKLRQICAKAMATDPAARYPSARACADALDGYLKRQDRRDDRLARALVAAAGGLCLGVLLVLTINLLLAAGTGRQAAARERAVQSVKTRQSGPQPSETLDPPRQPTGNFQEPTPQRVPSASPEVKLIGNTTTRVYHRAGCYHLASVAELHQAILAGPGEAAEKRYKACKACQPPVYSPAQPTSSSNSSAKN
jgi:hypothetical protein